MAVALVHRRIGGEAIKITVAVSIPNPDAFAARQNYSERMIIVGTKARLCLDEISVPWSHFSSLQFEPVMTWGIGPLLSREQSHCKSKTTGSQMSANRVDRKSHFKAARFGCLPDIVRCPT